MMNYMPHADAEPGALRVFTAGATREGFAALAGDFARHAGLNIHVATMHGHNIRDAVLAGEADTDLVSLPSHMIGVLQDAGLIAEDPAPVTIGSILIGAAARSGQPLPDVSDMEALRRTLRKSHSIVLTEAPSGVHMERVIDELKVRAEVDARIVRYDTGTMVNEHLVRSDALREVAFGVATEILFFRDRGVAYAGPLPEEVQMEHVYRVALLASAADRAADARRLFDFIATPPARDAFAETGVETD
jgi:molybdate transport system substrate-binding protein